MQGPSANRVHRGIVGAGTAGVLLFSLWGGLPARAEGATGMPQGLQGPGTGRTVAATRLLPHEEVTLDGRLDEPVWTRAPVAEGFLQLEPVEGQTPTERTEVWVAFDADHLYVGAMLHDSDPSGIIGYERQRDQGLGADDRFMLILDTFLDGRTGYFFETNPAGLMGDGLVQNTGNTRVNKAWDGIWEAQTARDAGGWSVEFRIPFRTLNFDERSAVWGINFQRTIRRKQEEIVWSGHRRNQGLLRPIHAGRLTGLTDVTQGLGLEVVPYGAAARREEAGFASETPLNVGADLNYSVTPSLRASLTVNTDFAEAEVDQRRVNLTRFPLFFPEQRAFFLENASVFEFAPLNGVRPYFSRRIGLEENAERAIPIEYGARLAGQAGAFDLGVLHVRTGDVETRPSETFTVARVKRNFLAQSSIGFIYTRRTTGPDPDQAVAPDRHTLGTDLDLFTSKFLGDKNLQLQAFYVWHTDPEPGDTSSAADRSSRGFRVNYPNDVWQMHLSYREFGDAWDPAVGFVSRRGFRRANPVVTFSPRPDWLARVRNLEFRAYYEHLTDLDNRLLTRETGLTLLGVNYDSGDEFNIRRHFRFEQLDDPFEIHDGVRLPVGPYTFDDWVVNLRSARHRPVSGRVRLRTGQFWSGDRSGIELAVTGRPYPGVTATAEWEHENVDLPQGVFTTDLLRLLGSWHASPWVSLDGNVQYDTITRITGLYTRLRWILRPGSDFYFVYTENWETIEDRFHTLSRGATTKINYTHRF